MRILLYDQNQQRNRSLHRYLEDAGIPITAAYCLRDLLLRFQSPSLKILIIEHSQIQHYNINVEQLLDQLGLTFTVIDYIETDTSFDFTVHYLLTYYYFPFTTENDKKLIKRIKKKLEIYKRHKKEHRYMKPSICNIHYTSMHDLQLIMEHLTEKQKTLITELLRKQGGIGIEEMIELLHAQNTKNSQNYVQAHIYRLRAKLKHFFGNEYIITYKNHTYQLVHTYTKLHA